MLAQRSILRNKSFIKRLASTLVIAEHDNADLTAGTLSTITAASKLSGEVTVLVTGKSIDGVAKQAASVEHVKKVITVDAPIFEHTLAEEMSKLVVQLSSSLSVNHILAPSSNNGKNFMPRAAAQLNVAPLTDILEVIDDNTFKRPMYAGNAIATVKMNSPIKMLVVRPTAFEKAAVQDAPSASIEAAPAMTEDNTGAIGLSEFVSASASNSDRPDLTAARVVVSGGRGMKNGENFAMLEELADKLGGAVGASRAAVDAGFVPNEYQVGQTGKVVAPDLYIAVGISGAIQHLSGMKDSKTIVAINKDKEAPIFQVADYGLVDDLFKVVPDLTAKI